MSDNESEINNVEEQQDDNDTIVSLEAKDMRKKKERKPYNVSEKALAARKLNLEKAKAKNLEREKAKYLALKEKYEKEEQQEKMKPITEDVEEEEEETPKPTRANSQTLMTIKKGKKKVKKVIYQDSSDSSDSEEEEVIVKRKKSRSGKLRKTDEELLEMELERRLKMREEQDEYAKMEKAALQKRYKEKLAETKRNHMNTYMFPQSEWSFKKR